MTFFGYHCVACARQVGYMSVRVRKCACVYQVFKTEKHMYMTIKLVFVCCFLINDDLSESCKSSHCTHIALIQNVTNDNEERVSDRPIG